MANMHSLTTRSKVKMWHSDETLQYVVIASVNQIHDSHTTWQTYVVAIYTRQHTSIFNTQLPVVVDLTL